MTDNEIIKALECCVNNQYCWLCVLKDREDDCYNILKSAFDLINRQKADIETAKAKAIREFAEEHKKIMRGFLYNDSTDFLMKWCEYETNTDNLVKEMTEG